MNQIFSNFKRQMFLFILLFNCLPFFVLSLSFAKSLIVPSEYSTIENAINEANDGDEIIVSDGIHTGSGNKNLNMPNKSIIVKSANGPLSCIIDCENDGRAFNFDGKGSMITIDGFTIRNGNVSSYGGWGGGGIYCGQSSPVIKNTIFFQNTAIYGAGITLFNSNATIFNCVFHGNNASNQGGGLWLLSCSTLKIDNCTFVNNSGSQVIWSQDLDHVYITNCLFWGNSGYSVEKYDGGITLNYCLINTNSIKNNIIAKNIIDSDPLLEGTNSQLTVNSPCIDAGISIEGIPTKDIIGNPRKGRIDIGAFEYQKEYQRLPGDIDGDSLVGLLDVLTLIQFIINESPVIDQTKGDFTGDGIINIFDAVKLVKYITQQIESL